MLTKEERYKSAYHTLSVPCPPSILTPRLSYSIISHVQTYREKKQEEKKENKEKRRREKQSNWITALRPIDSCQQLQFISNEYYQLIN